MSTLKYKVISSSTQYNEYCNILERLAFSGTKDRNTKDEMALLTLLIEKWDEEHDTLGNLDPVQLLHALMKDHNLRAKDIVVILDISKGYVSDILNYKKGFSKDVIRKLSAYFKVSQEAFNRPYKLKLTDKTAIFRNGKPINQKNKRKVA